MAKPSVSLRTIRPDEHTGFRYTMYGVRRTWADGTTTEEYFDSPRDAMAHVQYLKRLLGETRRRAPHPRSRDQRLVIERELARRRAQARSQSRTKKGKFS